MRYRVAETVRGTALSTLGFGAASHSCPSKQNEIDGRPESRHW